MGLLESKDKVGRFLFDGFGPSVGLTERGFTFRSGSTRVFINLAELGEGENAFTVAYVTAPVASGVKGTPELFEYVARHADDKVFGHLGLVDVDDGHLDVIFTHTILTDYLDPEELLHAAGAVAGTADDMDNAFVAQFGGRVYHED